jgi:hypothetical protein
MQTKSTAMPEASVVHTVYHGPAITNARPSVSPDKPTYAVWAYKLTDGKCVKDEKYSWTTTDPLQGWKYAKKVNAVPGWSATTNCPPPVPKSQRYVDGGMVQGAEYYRDYGYGTSSYVNGAGERVIHIPFFNMTVRIPAGDSEDLGPGEYDTTPAYDNSEALQDSLNLQNMLSTQDMINTQNMLNTQNMINNQNQFNDMENMINTQNEVNNQMMMDAQNAMNAQMNQ